MYGALKGLSSAAELEPVADLISEPDMSARQVAWWLFKQATDLGVRNVFLATNAKHDEVSAADLGCCIHFICNPLFQL